MALGAQHASPCAPGRRRARIALETQPLPAALPAAVLRIALGLSITQRAARPRRGRRGLRPRPAALYIHHITARQNIWPEAVLQVPKRSGAMLWHELDDGSRAFFSLARGCPPWPRRRGASTPQV